MESTTSKKKPIIIGVSILAIIIAILLFILLRPNGYLSIKILEIFGTVTYDRNGENDVPVYDDLKLTGGDRMKTATKSYARLSLDDDKFVYIEEKSDLSFDSTRKDRIEINLKEGAIINEIENKLGENESYEVKTPNALMAVRGTRFRVSCYKGADGIFYTRISGVEGKVECRLIYPDGSISESFIITDAGSEALIYYDSKSKTTDFVKFDTNGNPNTKSGKNLRPIRYYEFPKPTLEYLLRRIDEGIDMGIAKEDIQNLLENVDLEDEPLLIVEKENKSIEDMADNVSSKKNNKNSSTTTERRLPYNRRQNVAVNTPPADTNNTLTNEGINNPSNNTNTDNNADKKNDTNKPSKDKNNNTNNKDNNNTNNANGNTDNNTGGNTDNSNSNSGNNTSNSDSGNTTPNADNNTNSNNTGDSNGNDNNSSDNNTGSSGDTPNSDTTPDSSNEITNFSASASIDVDNPGKYTLTNDRSNSNMYYLDLNNNTEHLDETVINLSTTLTNPNENLYNVEYNWSSPQQMQIYRSDMGDSATAELSKDYVGIGPLEIVVKATLFYYSDGSEVANSTKEQKVTIELRNF